MEDCAKESMAAVSQEVKALQQYARNDVVVFAVFIVSHYFVHVICFISG